MGEARAPDLRGSGAWGRGHVAGGTSMNRSCAFLFLFRASCILVRCRAAVANNIGRLLEADIDGLVLGL